jgi:FkbM family methyltransferase
MISYAQNHEDVVLARAFDKPTGFYVDVGAGSPVIHSVTNHFYQRGWRGINVEPLELWHRELAEARPQDVNLHVGLSNEPGMLDFFDVSADASEESTFSPEVADSLRARGFAPHIRQVPVTTLAAVCEERVEQHIDFLKIDVEGFELKVLQGGDWDEYRPSVVIVESTEPGTSHRAGAEVEGFMEAVRYLPTLFDGLNVFYVREEDEPLRETLSVPANVNDRFEDVELAELRDSELRSERRANELAAASQRAERRTGELERTAEESRREVARLEKRLGRAQQDVATARRDATDAHIQFAATREALERLPSEHVTADA